MVNSYMETVYTYRTGLPIYGPDDRRLDAAGWTLVQIVCQKILDDGLTVSKLWRSPGSFVGV